MNDGTLKLAVGACCGECGKCLDRLFFSVKTLLEFVDHV